MANYIAYARTNYFRVVDVDKFKEFLDTVCGISEVIENEGTFCLLFEEGIPDTRAVSDGDSDDSLDLVKEVSRHLQEDSVAIFMECGAEKLRYLAGYAVAVNHEGRAVEVGINDIYSKAKEKFGDKCEITQAEY